MKTRIVAKVKINFDDPTKTDVIVRKVVCDDDDQVIGVYGLSNRGDWVPKEEGKPYPPECHWPVMIYDNFSPMGILDEWQEEEISEQITAEQEARNMLERMGIEDAQEFSSGDLVELANLIAANSPSGRRRKK